MSLLLDALKKAAEKNDEKALLSSEEKLDYPVKTGDSLADIPETDDDENVNFTNIDDLSLVDESDNHSSEEFSNEELSLNDRSQLTSLDHVEKDTPFDAETLEDISNANQELALELEKPLADSPDHLDLEDNSQLVFLADQEKPLPKPKTNSSFLNNRTHNAEHTDTYDRSAYKLDDQDITTFTLTNSEIDKSLVSPEMAKLVFASKTSVLHNKNYRMYVLMSLLILSVIALFTFYQIQNHMSEINLGLASLKKNPISFEIKPVKTNETLVDSLILEGNIDEGAMNLLKSLEAESLENDEQNNEEAIQTTEQKPADNLNSLVPELDETTVENPLEETNKPLNENNKSMTKVVEKQEITAIKNKKENNSESVTTPKLPDTSEVSRQAIKKSQQPRIQIDTQVNENKETIFLQQAYKAYERGDYDLAIQKYNDVLEVHPNNRDALLGQAAIFSLNNDTQRAIQNYQRILTQNPKDVLTITSLISLSSLSPVESETQLKILQNEQPNADYLKFALGNAIGVQGRWKEAQTFYFEAYQANPKNPDYAYNLAISLEQIDQPKAALDFYKIALKNLQFSSGAFDETLIQARIEELSQ